jgi:hypothetical protein
MPPHKTLAELSAVIPHIAASPKDGGIVRAIVIRPKPGERQMLETCEISVKGGVHGDSWAEGCWKETDDGKPHPDVQVCVMNSRTIEVIAGERANWALPGGQVLGRQIKIDE